MESTESSMIVSPVGYLFKRLRPHRTVVDAKILEEDTQRRRFILRILLIGSMALNVVALLTTTIEYFKLQDRYRGSNPLWLLLALAIFMALFVLTEKIPLVIAGIFCGIYYLIGTLILVTWGTNVPQGDLIYVLLIVIVGILMGTRWAFFSTCILGCTMLGLNYLQLHGITHPDLYWIHDNASYSDIVIFLFSFLIIYYVSWLSNREIARSLLRARVSEAEVLHERDQLEVKVEERTRELREAQQQEIAQLYRFAQFGRLSSELLHDLVDPLSAVSLNLQQLTQTERSDLVQRALQGTHKMEQFVAAARKQIQQQRQVAHFSLRDAVKEAVQVLKSKADKAEVTIHVVSADSLKVYADPIRFHRLVSNLVSNALDSFDDKPGEGNEVTVSLRKQEPGIILTVTDNGAGIPASILPHVFEPFYTTKSAAKGTGLGLAICKEIAEQEFDGSLDIESKEGVGTTVTVRLLMGNAKK